MPLPRLHLFELEDQSWFPGWLRDFATDYLQAVQHLYPFDEALVAPLEEILRTTDETHIVDLCSGASGPVLGVLRQLEASGRTASVTLTDAYPNLRAFERLQRAHPRVDFRAEPVDARSVPRHLRGVRTVFNGIHHFRPAQVEEILRDGVSAGAPMAVFEITGRSVVQVASMLLSPLMVWGVTPRIRPFSWARLLFTYVLPLVPLVVLWDGVVSQLRGYTPTEFLEMAQRSGPDYVWQAGTVSAGPIPITYLTGRPAEPAVRPVPPIARGTREAGYPAAP